MSEQSERPPGPLWQREAELVGVDFPDRTIDLIVIPYEREALVGWEGRMVTETIDRGAFAGIERRANRVRVNRDHNLERTIGRASRFDPCHETGLMARLKIARTPLGDETLELADDGCLDASAGFLPMPGGMHWQDRSSYHVSKAWLGHVALLPEPAYEDARVLAVRSQAVVPASGTPNLDTVRGWILEARAVTLPASTEH